MARVSRTYVCALLIALGLAVSGCSSALRLTGLGGFDDEPAVANPAVVNPAVANPVVANPTSNKMQVGDRINVTV